MQGRILGFDEAAGTGMISGEDGRRYRFGKADWRGGGAPRAGAAVDFDANGDAAADIYPAVAARAAGAAPAVTLPPDAAAKIKALFTESLATPLALVIIVACFLPALTTPIHSVSLFGLDSTIGRSVGAAAAFMGNGSVSGVSGLLVLRFLAPLAAVALIVLDWLGKPLNLPMIVTGAVAILVGLIVFAYKSAIVSTFDRVTSGLSSFGVPSPGDMIGVGFGVWLLAIAGIALIVAGIGKIHNPLRSGESASAGGD
jgi:hypothetical protein